MQPSTISSTALAHIWKERNYLKSMKPIPSLLEMCVIKHNFQNFQMETIWNKYQSKK